MIRAVDLTVIIVNYNTVQDLKNCLTSIFESDQDIAFTVWVVDNNSGDGSADMVASMFPEVRLTRNPQNRGFAHANNVVLKQVSNPFVLLLNPDTILCDHAFDRPIAFLEENPDAGMASCRLIKADGSLDLACRRSFPSAFDGFCRASRISRLFPYSKLFARYNLTYLDENEISEVDAVNGAYMMVRREAIDKVGFLDEDYFMYMEDLDWCYRFKQKGWKVYYLPEPSVIHLKGQSAKKASERMIEEFFRSMILFCQKNYFNNRLTLRSLSTSAGISIWKHATLWLNAMRMDKRVTP